MTKEERLAKKREYKGPKYDVPAGDVGKVCSCGVTIHFVKTKTGKSMPVEYDGIPHWGFCDDANRYSKK